MKKRETKLRLNRETLRLLEDGFLGQPVGGNWPTNHTLPPVPTQNVCTLTCVC
jgi:hypothetical protein